MRLADIPAKVSTPWAAAATGAYIRAIPTPSQIGVTDGAASWADGFPPLNFTAIQTGGVPPFGSDFNGVLNEITGWLRWMATGAPVPYDGAFQAAIGGYPAAARVWSSSIPGLVWQSLVDNNLTNPDASGGGWTVTTLIDPNIAALQLVGLGPNGAGIKFTGDGAIAPNKWIRVRGGVIEIVNSAYSAVIASIDDAGSIFSNGNITAQGSVGSIYDVTAGRQLVSPQVTGSTRVDGGYVHSFGEVHADTNVTAAFDVNAQRNVSASGGILAGGNIGAGGDSTAGNNIWAGGRVRSNNGAYGSGDSAACTILRDFQFTVFDLQTGYTRLPNGTALIAGQSSTTTGAGDLINFPVAFDHGCWQVVVTDAWPSSWVETPTPLQVTAWALDSIGQGGFRISSAVWLQASGAWVINAPRGFRYIAIGS